MPGPPREVYRCSEKMLSPENSRPNTLPILPPGGGLHLHVGRHPDHGALFGDHRFSVFQFANDGGSGFAFDGVLHTVTLTFLVSFLYAVVWDAIP